MTLQIILQNNSDKSLRVPAKKTFLHWAEKTLQAVPSQKKSLKKNELCIRIINKKESALLNQQFRKKKGPTNIISFSYPDSSLLGDLVICAQLVYEEAHHQKKTVRSHWAHLTVHGILHLLGYDHKKTNEAKKMEILEINILKKLGFPNPY